VDVADLVGPQAGPLENRLHRPHDAGAAGTVLMAAAVTAAAHAEDLGIDVGSAGESVRVALNDEHRRSLADDRAVAVAIERPAGAQRIVVPLREPLVE